MPSMRDAKHMPLMVALKPAGVGRGEGDVGASVHRANSPAAARAGRKRRGGEGAARALECAARESGRNK